MSDNAKVVALIASGETERRALPHMMAHLRDQDIWVRAPLVPPRNGALKPETVANLIRVAQYDESKPPDKYVILIDVDGKDPNDTLAPFWTQVPNRLEPQLRSRVLYAYAQWHLEAWYFADATNLRQYLGRALGSVDTSHPDDIQNPKQHLKNLLPNRIYTSRTAENIAQQINAVQSLTAAPASPVNNGC